MQDVLYLQIQGTEDPEHRNRKGCLSKNDLRITAGFGVGALFFFFELDPTETEQH